MDTGNGTVEINICRTKEPLPPGRTGQPIADPRPALPGATVSLKTASKVQEARR